MRIDGTKNFTVEVSPSQADSVKISSPVCIVAQCRVSNYVDNFNALFKAHDTHLFEGLRNPSKLRGFTSNIVDCCYAMKHQKRVCKYTFYL